MESDKGHDLIFRDFFCKKFNCRELDKGSIEKITPIVSYLHDIFKGLVPKGDSEGDLSLKRIYEENDREASKAEQSKYFIGTDKANNETIMCYLENLPSAMLSPFNLSPQFYLTTRFKSSDFTGSFETQSKFLKEYLIYRYGEDTYKECTTLIKNTTLDNKCFKLLIDSIRFFPQRSWISGNDISILAHLRGTLLASFLQDISLIEINNPFYTNFQTLKDAEGAYAITKIFLYYLNCLILKEVTGYTSRDLTFLDQGSDCEPPLGVDTYESPLIDFFTYFTFSADHNKILLFVRSKLLEWKNNSLVLEEIIREAIRRTLNEILNEFNTNSFTTVVKVIVAITNRYIQVGKPELPDKARVLNEILSHREDVVFSKQEVMDVELDKALEEGNDLCEVCKFRRAVKLRDNLKNLVGGDVKLCNVCLAVRLAPFHLGRGSIVRKGESLSEIEKVGWGSLLQIDESIRKSRSIDEISSDDIVFLVMKLNLDLQERHINLEEYYNTVIQKIFDRIKLAVNDRIKPVVKEFLEKVVESLKSVGSENQTVKECLSKITSLEINDNIAEKFILNLTSQLLEADLQLKRIDANKISEFLVDEAHCEGNRNMLVNIIKTNLIGKLSNLSLSSSITMLDLEPDENEWNNLKKIIKYVQNKDESPLVELIKAINTKEIEIPKSLDREFSLRAHFSILGEEILALLYKRIKRRPQQIILITPSMSTPLLMTVIRKEDLHEVIGILKELADMTINELSPIPSSILIYLIKAKTYTPIQYIFEILRKKEINSNSNSSIKVIPVIVGRNNIPLTPLYAFTLSNFTGAYEKLISEIKDKESFVEFFITSAQDLPYPEFKTTQSFRT
ncbi:hypothetical protein [Sulfolobus sp. E11-6]|uniref:hypothetical protein n=1 Tax=Sulfolobus sp. E11-6 TaxID=2663020 RepID=UPI001296EFAA|nr:hypothetical protein [Sulfolobus sp. E11-6]QGA68933.1 hypothetical protein GFS33_09585 [Sulfolobus sp. E11-6]